MNEAAAPQQADPKTERRSLFKKGAGWVWYALGVLGTVTLLASLGDNLIVGVQWLVDVVNVYRSLVYPVVHFLSAWFPDNWPRVSGLTIDIALVATLILSRAESKRSLTWSIIARTTLSIFYIVTGYLIFDVALSSDHNSFYGIIVGLALTGLATSALDVARLPHIRFRRDVPWGWIANGVVLLVAVVSIYSLNQHADTALPVLERWREAAVDLWNSLAVPQSEQR